MPRAAPAAGRLGGLAIELFLGADQDVGKLLISGTPCVDDFVGGDLESTVTRNLLKRWPANE